VALVPKRRRAADPFVQEWHHGASFHDKQIKTIKLKRKRAIYLMYKNGIIVSSFAMNK
jgi:hypothetical protein